MKKIKKRSDKRMAEVFPIIIYTVIIIWCVLFMSTLAWAVVQSFKSKTNFYYDKVGFPSTKYGGMYFGNYEFVFTKMRAIKADGTWVYFPTMLYNTLFYCIVYSFFGVFCPMLTSYAYAKYHNRVPFTQIAWWLTLISIYVPLSASLASGLSLAMRFKYYDNMYAFLITSVGGFGSNFLIYYAVWKGLSWTYAEAAFIDGASHTQVLFRVMFPMTVTIFGVLFVTGIINLWANYQLPLVYLPSYPTLAYGVYRFQSSVESGITVPIKIASLIVVAIPLVILFMAFKEKIMTSLTMGGIKG